jgi:hypothetical protein
VLRAGHRVAVTARDKVRLEKLTEAHPDAVLPLSMDPTKPSEIKAAITTAEKWHGGIDGALRDDEQAQAAVPLPEERAPQAERPRHGPSRDLAEARPAQGREVRDSPQQLNVVSGETGRARRAAPPTRLGRNPSRQGGLWVRDGRCPGGWRDAGAATMIQRREISAQLPPQCHHE